MKLPSATAASPPPRLHGNDGYQRRSENIHEVVTEQDQPDDPVRPLQQLLGKSRTAVALTGFVAQLVSIEAHESRFRARETGRKKKQEYEQTDQGRQRLVIAQ